MMSLFIDCVNIFISFTSRALSAFFEKSDTFRRSAKSSEINYAKTENISEIQQKTRKDSILTGMQRHLFQYWIRCSTSPQWLVIRCQILLALDEGKPKRQIAREQRKDIKTVQKWAKRWRAAKRELSKLEATEIKNKEYCKRVIEVLSDATRCGRPVIFTAEQVVQIIALACEVTDASDKEISHRTWGDIAREAVSRGITENISRASVGRFLKEARIKPHRSRYWLNAQPEDPEQFDEEIKTICKLYHNALLFHKQGIYVISTDEKTGIQALERRHPTHPAKPYRDKTSTELREHGYERHGTLCLMANFEVATGRIISPTIGPTRTEEDFLNHIKKTLTVAPQAEWIFVTDQLNTHLSESLVRLIAEECSIKKDLGVKGKSGILASMVTRRAFLSDPEHRIRFVYTPKHTSWMNQVELWFSILTRRLLKRGSFHSSDHLRERILKFIDFFNETMAKPFRWTYKGRPLTV